MAASIFEFIPMVYLMKNKEYEERPMMVMFTASRWEY